MESKEGNIENTRTSEKPKMKTVNEQGGRSQQGSNDTEEDDRETYCFSTPLRTAVNP